MSTVIDARLTQGAQELLRRLVLNDERTVRAALEGGASALADTPVLDRKTEALVGLAALLSVGANATACRVAVEHARGARASDEELVAVLLAVAPAIGYARGVGTAPALERAMGFDETTRLD